MIRRAPLPFLTLKPFLIDSNFAVQKTIDRRLCELFPEADHRYNSGLFHFAAEKDRRELPDECILGLTVDDAVLKEIIRKLHYPDSPYEFSVIGADILGQVYEPILGKVIRLTAGDQAKVEEKPEVRQVGARDWTYGVVDLLVPLEVGLCAPLRLGLHSSAAGVESGCKRAG